MAYGTGYSNLDILEIISTLNSSLISASFPIEQKVTEMICMRLFINLFNVYNIIVALREATMQQKRTIKAIMKTTKERVGGVGKGLYIQLQ